MIDGPSHEEEDVQALLSQLGTQATTPIQPAPFPVAKAAPPQKPRLAEVNSVQNTITFLTLIVVLPVAALTALGGHFLLVYRGSDFGPLFWWLYIGGLVFGFAWLTSGWVKRLRIDAETEEPTAETLTPQGVGMMSGVALLFLLMIFMSSCFAIGTGL